MKLPRDVTGRKLVKELRALGYEPKRQTGSHIHLVTQRHGEHHAVVPDHRPIKPGTLSKLLNQIAEHHGMSRDEVINLLRL
ncbi:MAG: type II toxin-antitoxin system HicA family toxin [Planctomycetota bacterium]